LTFDLSHRIKKNSTKETEKKLSGGEKSMEPSRRATEEDPSAGWREQSMSCDQSYINTV